MGISVCTTFSQVAWRGSDSSIVPGLHKLGISIHTWSSVASRQFSSPRNQGSFFCSKSGLRFRSWPWSSNYIKKQNQLSGTSDKPQNLANYNHSELWVQKVSFFTPEKSKNLHSSTGVLSWIHLVRQAVSLTELFGLLCRLCLRLSMSQPCMWLFRQCCPSTPLDVQLVGACEEWEPPLDTSSVMGLTVINMWVVIDWELVRIDRANPSPKRSSNL